MKIRAMNFLRVRFVGLLLILVPVIRSFGSRLVGSYLVPSRANFVDEDMPEWIPRKTNILSTGVPILNRNGESILFAKTHYYEPPSVEGARDSSAYISRSAEILSYLD